jgi:hypothetical protein
MKVFERILKACLGRKVRVNYGRCVSSGRVSKCSIDGILLAFDNLCLVVAVVNDRGDIKRIVVVKKSEVESIDLTDEETMQAVYEILS